MSTEPSNLPPAPKSKQNPSTIGLAVRLAEQTKDRPATPRRTAASATLSGICLVFVVAMIAVPRLDTPLRVALLTFVVAIPFMFQEIMLAGVKIPFRVHAPRIIFLPKTLSVASWLLSSIGYLAAAVGFVGIVWHLWELAALVLIGSFVVLLIMTVALAAVLFIARLLQLPRIKKQRQKRATPAS